MSIANCPGCWEAVCECGDGKGYRKYSDEQLLRIYAAIQAECIRRGKEKLAAQKGKAP